MKAAGDPHRRIRHPPPWPHPMQRRSRRGRQAALAGSSARQDLNARGAGPRRGMPCRRAPAQGPARPEAQGQGIAAEMRPWTARAFWRSE